MIFLLGNLSYILWLCYCKDNTIAVSLSMSDFYVHLAKGLLPMNSSVRPSVSWLSGYQFLEQILNSYPTNYPTKNAFVIFLIEAYCAPKLATWPRTRANAIIASFCECFNKLFDSIADSIFSCLAKNTINLKQTDKRIDWQTDR